MIRNYFKIAWRNLKKQAFFTFLNTFGLAIGMAGGLLIALYIYDEMSFDKMFADTDRIYRINADIKFGGEASETAEVSDPMAATAKKDYPQLELTTRFRNRGSKLLRQINADQNVKEEHTTYVDNSFFEMFGIDLLYGDPKTALTEPNTLILTKTAAEKHFKINEAIGKSLVLDNNDTYIVTGIIDDLPENSFLRNHSVFMSMAGYSASKENNWGSSNFPTFVKLIPNAKIEDFQVYLNTVFGKYVIPYVQTFMPGITEEQFLASGNYYNFNTTNLKDIHLHSNRDSEMSPNGSMQNIYILSFIALFLIILASVNFMNLSTAHSLKRAKEVGIRKTIGSTKLELINQFLTESGLISFISLLFAIAIAASAMPFFNELSDKSLSIPFTNPIFWLILLISGTLLGLLSGIYPAFFMSRFIPVKVLKGYGESSTGGTTVRNSLVVFQFAISVFLIVSTLVVFQQLKYMQNKDLGYSKDQILVIQDVDATGKSVQAFRQRIKQLGQVKNVTLSSYYPTPSSRSNSSFFEEGKMEQENAILMQEWRVDFDYVSTLDLEIIAGRDFDKQFSTDSLGIIINESTVAILGVSPEEAIGKKLTDLGNDEEPIFHPIIGVVKNFHFESLKKNIGALSLSIGNFSSAMAVKINVGNFSNTISNIENIWKTMAPGQPFNYYFMDDAFNTTYKAEQRLGRIFTVFTILSILIACLGLFGLAAFNAEKRYKEIGIRKVLGASVSQITYKLSIDFLKLVGIAILISVPLAWLAMNKWLEDFSYRTEISWGVFLIATLMALLVAILTVSSQSIKAALANPINSIKTE